MTMNDFVRCNKNAGVCWHKSPEKMSITIKLKLPEDLISLPKFENYSNECGDISLDQNIEQFSFKWQEKCFSAHDLQYYSEVHNCFTENEFKYHELLKNNERQPKKVFTYIHEDFFLPVPQEEKKLDSLLSSYLERLHLDGAVGRNWGDFGGKSISERHLFKSQEDFNVSEEEEWMAMHIALDHSDFNEETVILKREAILLSIYHNTKQNYIIISPDENNIETNPYNVETSAGDLLGYQYGVDIEFGGTEDNGDDLVVLLTKLYNKWENKHKSLVNFIMPPVGKVQYYITVDMTSATGFEMDNLYMEFNVKLPEGVDSKDSLLGRTHVSRATRVDAENVCHFGHLLELNLDNDSSLDAQPLKVYLEIISIDMWYRHRTEGYSYFLLPLTPGTKTIELNCVRPDELNGEERRFFVGGCHLIRDLEVLSNPQLQPGKYAYTPTGIIKVSHTVIAHSGRPRPAAGPARYDTSSTALLLSAEAALRKYKKARARLAFATTCL